MANDRFLSYPAASIRRLPSSPDWRIGGDAERAADVVETGEARWRSDLRMFAVTFVGGFVFFLTLIG